jgi:hypothetical protein
MIPVETIPGMGRGWDKGEWIKVWYIWYIVRTFVNATMYPHLAQLPQKQTNKQTNK